MNTTLEQLPGDENKNQQTGNQNNQTGSDETVPISLPRTDRPEGPFEHSGEVAGWTKEEREEQEQKEE